MPRSRRISVLIAVLAALAGACGDQGDKPTASETPAAHSVTGSVALISHLTDEVGQISGEERVDDASGLWIYCRHEGGALDSAVTAAGRFAFPAVRAGTCTLYVEVQRSRRAAQSVFEMPEHNHELADTLTLEPSDDLRIYPNPAHAKGAGIEFTTHSDQTYRVFVRDLAGNTIWSYEATAPAGFYHVHWPGTDHHGHEAEPGLYVVVVELDGGIIHGIVHWGDDHEPSDPGICGHFEADGVVIAHHDEILVTTWRGSRDGDLRIGVDEESHGYAVTFLDPDSSAFAVADTCPENHLSWSLADSNVATLRLVEGRKWSIRVVGKTAGSTDVTLHAWHEDAIVFDSPAIPIVVE